MPKEIFEIKHFQTGTITTPDVKDVPDDAAVYSKNLDPVVEQGKLKGIPKDKKYQHYKQSNVVHTGGTNNDLQISVTPSKFTNNALDTVIVKITDQDQGGDTFKYSVDNGANYNTGNQCPPVSQPFVMSNGLEIYFTNVSGHLSGEQWTIAPSLIKTDATKMGVVQNKGIRDLVLWDSTNNKFVKIEDLYGNDPSKSNIGAAVSSNNEVTMQSHNRELHIGVGGKGVTTDNENKPQWIGYPSHGQWGGDPPTDMIIADAELKAPSSIPLVHKVIKVGDYLYAIEWKGTKLYKYKDSDSTFVKTGGSFVQATAICKYDSNNILVFDQSSGTNGALLKVSASDMTVVSTFPLNGEYRGDVSKDIYSDIHITDMGGSDAKLWFSVYRSTGSFGTSERKILFNTDVPSSPGSSVTLTDRTWDMASVTDMYSSDDIGNWKSGADINTYKICLSDAMDSDAVSMVLDCNNKEIWTEYDDSDEVTVTASKSLGRTSIMVVKKDISTSGTGNQILNTSSAKVKLFRLTKYDDDTTFEDRTVTSVYYSSNKYYISYLSGTSNANGLFVSYSHQSIASSWTNFALDNNGLVPEIDAIDYELTSDNGSPSYAYASTSSGVKKFRGFSTYSIGQIITLTYNSTSDTFGSENVDSTNDVSFVVVKSSGAGNIGIEDTTTYQKYKVSYVYDSYQESPLSYEIASAEIDTNDFSIDLNIKIKTSNLSKRVSHLNIYRVQSKSSNPAGFYRLVKSIKLDDVWVSNDGTSGSGLVIGAHRYTDYSDTGSLGASYDARNGMSETLEDITPHYGLSAEVNSSMIVGNCWHNDLDDAEQYLFKSKIHKFDSYDWTSDFIKLPNKPTAMAGFQGRLYVFDSNTTWKINVNGMYIEDTFEGAGCVGPDAVMVTEYGMCFADKNNIYLHNGNMPTPIGASIQGYADWSTGTDLSWLSGDFSSYVPKILFDSKRNSFVIFFKSKNSSDYYAWAYNLPRKRWDMWSVEGEPKSVLTGEDGTMLVTVNNGLYLYLGDSSNTQSWEYVTKSLSFGYDMLDKKIYELKVSGDNIGIEHLGGTSSSDSKSLKIPVANRRQKSIQIKLTGDETDECDSLAVVYRRMPLTSGNI